MDYVAMIHGSSQLILRIRTSLIKNYVDFWGRKTKKLECNLKNLPKYFYTLELVKD